MARWEATGEAPCFEVTAGRPLPGWNMIEIACERSVTTVAASLTFETRRRSFSVDIPLRVGRVTKRMVFVPFGVRTVRFYPINAPGWFRLKHFRFAWLSPTFARDRLLQRLGNIHPAYQGLSRQETLRRLKEQAKLRGKSHWDLALREYDTTFVSLCSRRNYQVWINRRERLRRPTRRTAEKQLDVLSGQPGFSALVLVTDDDTALAVNATLESLQGQYYPDWRLVLAVDAALSKEVRTRLEDLVRRDSRVLLATTEATSPGARLNAALRRAVGEWVFTLAAGDRLAPHALFKLVLASTTDPRAQLLFSDEDWLDRDGRRHSPRFKPGWNPDLLLSSFYLGRLAAYRAGVLEELSGFRADPAFSSVLAVEHDLALRFMAMLGEGATDVVRHVPHILCHRSPVHYAETHGRISLEPVRRFIEGRGLQATAERGLLPDCVRVRWALPEPVPLVSLLIPTRDGVDILKPCVDAILSRTSYPNFEVLILDNQSRCPHTLEYMQAVAERDRRVRVLRWNHPFNYSAINNFGAGHARGTVLGLVNNDIEPIAPDWLSEMVAQANRPEIGCVGAKLYYPDDTVQHGGVILGVGGVAGHAHRFFHSDEDGYQGRLKQVQNLSAVTAACLVLRKAVFDEVGGLNEPDLAVAYNDVDLCLKVREAGYRNLWTPYAELYHHESVSRGADNTPRKRARAHREARYMQKTWGALLQHDPAYNPNLTLTQEDFSLR